MLRPYRPECVCSAALVVDAGTVRGDQPQVGSAGIERRVSGVRGPGPRPGAAVRRLALAPHRAGTDAANTDGHGVAIAPSLSPRWPGGAAAAYLARRRSSASSGGRTRRIGTALATMPRLGDRCGPFAMRLDCLGGARGVRDRYRDRPARPLRWLDAVSPVARGQLR